MTPLTTPTHPTTITTTHRPAPLPCGLNPHRSGRAKSDTPQFTGAVTAYKWNALHQLIRVIRADQTTVSYRYDGFGRRIEVDDNGIVTRFAYDGVNIRYVFNAANQRITTYITAPEGYDGILAAVVSMER